MNSTFVYLRLQFRHLSTRPLGGEGNRPITWEILTQEVGQHPPTPFNWTRHLSRHVALDDGANTRTTLPTLAEGKKIRVHRITQASTSTSTLPDLALYEGFLCA